MSSFSQSELEAALADLVPELKFLEETSSTNAVASEWGARGAPDGSIVITDHQTAGRGRLDRSWYAPRGECLLFSTILRPEGRSRAEQLGLLNLAAATALCASISNLARATVKWPNDVMIGGRKVAGILSGGFGGVAAPLSRDSRAPEAANPPKSSGGFGGVAAPLSRDSRAPEAANPPKSDGGFGGVAAPLSRDSRAPEAANPPKSSGGFGGAADGYVVVGVGVNVNVTEFSPELEATATSLLLETKAPADRLELLRGYLETFGRLYASFPEGVVAEFEPLCETLGLRVRVELSDHVVEDEAIGIDPNGGLMLAGGEVIRAGDVIHLRAP